MKSKILVILLIIATIAAGGAGFYFYRKNKNTQTSSNPTPTMTTAPTPYTATFTNYFVPVTGIKNPLLSISSTNLSKTEKVYVIQNELESIKTIPALQSANLVPVTSSEELIKTVNNNEKLIGIMSVDSLSFKVKSLEVDAMFLFNKNIDLAKYPLQYKKDMSSYQPITQTSNYSHKSLTKLGHTGSLIPARGVPVWTKKIHNGDYKKLFEPTKPLIDSFDYTSATFEAPVYKDGNNCGNCMVLVGPDAFMDGVKYSGIDLFSTAANHMLNAGVAGLENTHKKLDELGIKHMGSSTVNNDEAGKPVLVEVNGLKIAYLGFNDSPGIEEWAKADKPGSASISDWEIANGRTVKYEPNEERIKYFIQRAKDLKPDVIMAVMHWGAREYDNKPLPYTKKLGQLLLNNGVDVILGDHPHWVQEIEFKGDKPIFYSVGNYVFDQMWSIETRQGVTIEMNYVGKKLVNFRLFPHQLYLYDKGTVLPLKPEQKEYTDTLNRIWSVSNFKS